MKINKMIQCLELVQDSLFEGIHEELQNLDFDNLHNPIRSAIPGFSDTRSLYLHEIDGGTVGQVNGYDVRTKSNETNILKCPRIMNLANYVKNKVHGLKFGQIIISRLGPYGKVQPHIDPIKFFRCYSRFHIPLLTYNDIFFYNIEEEKFNMKQQYLYRLFGMTKHRVENHTPHNRFHLIMDIALHTPNLSIEEMYELEKNCNNEHIS
jgi:hypothetical protein